MNRASGISVLLVIGVALVSLSLPAWCEESAASEPDSSLSYRWGAVYTSLIELREKGYYFPWNDPSSHSYLTDRVSLMFDAEYAKSLHFFIKGTTGVRGGPKDEGVYQSRFYIDQGHISANWQDRVTGKLFIRERAFRNRNRLIYIVSNDSWLIRQRGEGYDIAVMTPGPFLLTYTGAVFRDSREQKQYFGLPPGDMEGAFLNLFEGGIQRDFWHAGLTISDVRSNKPHSYLEMYSAMYGLDAGVGLAGGRINLEFARSAASWSDFEDDLFGFDFEAMEWGNISAGLPEDGVLAAEWTGLAIHTEGAGRFGITPGYRYSGSWYRDYIGEVNRAIVESYIETWWKHPKLASLVTVKAGDRYDYRTGKGGGVLETSVWTRLKGGLETTARAFFAEGYRPVMIVSTVDDNNLTRLQMTARLDDTGGESEFSFLTEVGVNLGRRWTLGGSVYLERSVSGFYSADIEMRGSKRFVFKASAGTYNPGRTYASLNYDPSLPATNKVMTISFYTRIWLGGI